MGNVTKEYLIKQLHRFEELVLNHKFATPYTAGTGIDITNGVISTDLGTAAGKNFTTYVAPGVTDLPIGASVYAAITSASRGVLKPSGSKTCAQLTSDLLVQANVGNVYKVTDSGTTTELFVGGAGHTIHENDDVVVVYGGSDGVFKFDLQNGVIDMSDYQKKELDQPITVGGTEETTVEGALSALSTNKVEKVTGKGLSTNDYDNTEKQKVTNSVQKSNTAGLLKNDGTVDSTAYAKQSEILPKTNGASLDADNCTESGYYANVTSHIPVNGYGFSLFVELANSTTYCHQTAKQFIANDEPSVTYVRKGRYLDNAWVWSRWKKLVTESDLNGKPVNANDILTLASGYQIEDWAVNKLGDHVWGSFVLHNTDGDIPGSQTEVGNFSYGLSHSVNSVCFCSNNRYGGGAFYTGYLFIDSTGKILLGNPSGARTGINYAKISIDIRLINS